VYQQHDRHGGELLGEGSEPEIRMRVDLRFRTEIAHTVGPKTVFSPVTDQHRNARIIGLDKPVEYGIERSFGPLAILRARVPCGSQKPEQRAHEPQKALLQSSPHFGSKSISFRLFVKFGRSTQAAARR